MNKAWIPLFLWGMSFGGESREFSHHQHVKTEELKCSDCHSKVMNSTARLDSAKVSHKTCVKCHDDDESYKEVKPLVMTDPSFAIRERAEKGSLKFSHKAHSQAQVDCAQCHGDVLPKGAAPAGLSDANPLSMRSCMECHVRKAEVSCLTCHDKVEKPLNHLSAAWLKSEGHGLQSNLKGQDCAMCHDEAMAGVGADVGDCAECHMGTDARKVHGLNYRLNHGTDVKFKKLDCAVCHAPLEQFCGDCHEGKGRPAR